MTQFVFKLDFCHVEEEEKEKFHYNEQKSTLMSFKRGFV